VDEANKASFSTVLHYQRKANEFVYMLSEILIPTFHRTAFARVGDPAYSSAHAAGVLPVTRAAECARACVCVCVCVCFEGGGSLIFHLLQKKCQCNLAIQGQFRPCEGCSLCVEHLRTEISYFPQRQIYGPLGSTLSTFWDPIRPPK
jgi:hypothetical protein